MFARPEVIDPQFAIRGRRLSTSFEENGFWLTFGEGASSGVDLYG